MAWFEGMERLLERDVPRSKVPRPPLSHHWKRDDVKGKRSMMTLPSLKILKLTFSAWKIGHPKSEVVFQPSIFRCYVSFREGIYSMYEHVFLV